MFYSAELLSKRSPLGAVWLLAHGKKLSKVKIMSVNVSETCDRILDPEVPHALRLQAILVGGIVVIHSKQQMYLYDDAKNMMRQVASGFGGGEGGEALLPLHPPEGGGGGGAGTTAAGAAGANTALDAEADAAAAFAGLGGLGGLGPMMPGEAAGRRGEKSSINLVVDGGAANNINLVDFGDGTQNLLAQLDELNGMNQTAGGGFGAAGPLSMMAGGEDLFMVPAADASAAVGSMSRGRAPEEIAAARGTIRALGSARAAKFGGYGVDGEGEIPFGGGGVVGGDEGAGGGVGAGVVGDLAAGPEALLDEFQKGDGFGGGGVGGDWGMMPNAEQLLEGDVVVDVGGARLGQRQQQQARKLPPRRVVRPVIDSETAGLMPSAVLRGWIQDASPTLVPGGRGNGDVPAAEEIVAAASSTTKAKGKKRSLSASATSLPIDELRRRLMPLGPFDLSAGPWPEQLRGMLLSRMTLPGVADDVAAPAKKRRTKAATAAEAAAAQKASAPPSPAAAGAVRADAFAEANAGGENVHDFGFGEAAGGGGFGGGFGGGRDDFGGGGGDGFGGGWRLSPADALVAASGGDFFEGGASVPMGDAGGIERMRAAFLGSATAAACNLGAAADVVSPGAPGGGRGAATSKGTSSGERPSSDADGTRSGEEEVGNGGGRRGDGGGGADLGALDEEFATTQFPPGGSLLVETQEEARARGVVQQAQLPRIDELPVATRAAVQAMRSRFSAMVSSGRAPRISLDDATGATGAATATTLGRLDAARLFYQVCASVSAGYVKAAQRTPYGDVLLAPGRAMGDLAAAGRGGGGAGVSGRRAGEFAAPPGRVVLARA